MDATTLRWMFCAVLALSGSAQAAGLVRSDNFLVMTPVVADQATAETLASEVLKQAEHYRREIARHWLGDELPPGIGPAVIDVRLSDELDRGRTWARDDPQRRFHNVYLNTSRQRALGSTLAHEIVHVVLATQYPHPHRLPTWVEEGIASAYDDPERVAARERTLGWYASSGNWPKLQSLLETTTLTADDRAGYATAASLTNFLLTRGDRKRLLTFARQGQELGWGTALLQNYQITSVDQLQAQWQQWLAEQMKQANRVARR